MLTNKKNIKVILGLIVFGLVLWAIFYYFGTVLSGVKWVIALFVPFIIGACMAFVINIPMCWFEKVLFKPENIEGKKILQKLKVPVSMLLAFILVLAIIAAASLVIVPQLIRAIVTISEKVPVYVSTIQQLASEINAQYPEISQMMVSFSVNLNDLSGEVVDFLKSQGLGMLKSTFTAASSIAGTIVNFLIGFVFCIYCLLAKYTLTGQFRRILYAFFKESHADEILRVLRMASASFSGFITGQCAEAFICAVIYSLAFWIFRIPYALMIGVIIGLFSLIPIVGSIIGFVIGVLLVFLKSPVALLWYTIIFLVAHQIESKIIYPKVVGDKVGLPAIWVLVAVLIGGSAFGIAGMIMMIPVCSVLYTLLTEKVNFNLSKKNIPDEKLAEPKKKKEHKKDKSVEEQPENDSLA